MKRCRRCRFFAVVLSLSWLPAAADDNLELDGATITGNRELPKALHIVPEGRRTWELAGRRAKPGG
jgi:hypothetical protein